MNKLIIGFTAGLIFGILYAPASGRDTRKKLRGIGNNIADGWNDVTDIVTDKIESLKGDMDHAADQTVLTIEETRFGE